MSAANNLCALAPADQVAATLGQTAPIPVSSGPAIDEGHADALSTSCRFETKSRVLAIILLEFKTDDDAAKALADDRKAAEAAKNTRFMPLFDKALGDQAFLAMDSTAATYVMRKDTRLLLVGIAGTDLDATSAQPKLLGLAKSVVAKL
jgi:hypothetical protein